MGADTLPDNLVSIADVPTLAGDDPTPKSEVTLFKLGRFRHPVSGRWTITADFYESVLRNFQASGRRPIPIDVDHAPERGGSTEAYGWITDLRVDGDELKASVEWTASGTEAIKTRRYLFFSPSWAFAGRDETGAKVGGKLLGAGLTNRPFFPWTTISFASAVEADGAMFATVDEDPPPEPGQQVTITVAGDLDPQLAQLAAELVADANRPGGLQVTQPFLRAPEGLPKIDDADQLKAAVAAWEAEPGDDALKAHLIARARDLDMVDALPDGWADDPSKTANDPPEEPPKPSDSRPGMTDFATIADALGLEKDSDEQAIIAAVGSLKERAEQPLKGVVITPDGDVVMTSAQALDLQERAKRGDDAVRRESRMRFDQAFDLAMRQGRAAPSMRSHYETFFASDQDGALKALADLPQIVGITPLGQSGAAPVPTEVRRGKDFHLDEGSAELDKDALDIHERAMAYCASNPAADYGETYIAISDGRL